MSDYAAFGIRFYWIVDPMLPQSHAQLARAVPPPAKTIGWAEVVFA